MVFNLKRKSIMKLQKVFLTTGYIVIVGLLTIIYCNLQKGLNIDYNVQINKINDSLSITETDIPE